VTALFTHDGKTYVVVVATVAPGAPARVAVAFRPCAWKPPRTVWLVHVGRDTARNVELYRTDDVQPGDVATTAL
jgi:hypothetical protein